MSEQVRFVTMGIGERAVPYPEAWDEQQRLHALRQADEIPDTVLLLEHQPVYTAGKRTKPEDLPLDGTPVVEVNRGGEATWHGPGQLIGYPIVKLPEPMDVVAYVRRLEEALIRSCAEIGVASSRVEGRSGVWVLGQDLPDAPVDPAQVIDIGKLTLRMGLPLGIDPRLAGPVRAVQRRSARGRPQARRDRRAGGAGRDDARIRAQLQPGHDLVRPDHSVRHPRRRGRLARHRARPGLLGRPGAAGGAAAPG